MKSATIVAGAVLLALLAAGCQSAPQPNPPMPCGCKRPMPEPPTQSEAPAPKAA